MKKLLLLMFLTNGIYAAIPPKITLKGHILSFDKKNVTISNPTKDIVLPRSAISKGQEIKVGRYVSATIKSDFILKNIAERKKKISDQKRKNRFKKK
ncbi:MAG: hypothetical protein OXB84_08225 [Halobacteriovoraceae bacterium]|nr:hypothetical protein [Halobacteriovoraceae bacterium]